MSYVQIFLVFLAALAAVIFWRYPRRRVILRHAVALRTEGDPRTVVIPAGVTLPFFFSDLFRNAEPDQERVVISLFQLDGELERELDIITLNGMPPRPPGMLELEIRLVLSRRKRLKVIVKSHDARLLETFGPYAVE